MDKPHPREYMDIRDMLAAKTLEHPFYRAIQDEPCKPTLTYIPGKIKVKVFFAWYDFWVGFYYDREFKELYVCPFPCIVFKFYRVTEVVEDEDFTIELSDILKSKADSGR